MLLLRYDLKAESFSPSWINGDDTSQAAGFFRSKNNPMGIKRGFGRCQWDATWGSEDLRQCLDNQFIRTSMTSIYGWKIESLIGIGSKRLHLDPISLVVTCDDPIGAMDARHALIDTCIKGCDRKSSHDPLIEFKSNHLPIDGGIVAAKNATPIGPVIQCLKNFF